MLVLQTNKSTLDFLQFPSLQKVGSAPIPAKDVTFYAGAGAVFEYDQALRSLTRIGVPNGRREKPIIFPKHVVLHGIGMGQSPQDPLTLFIERRSNEESAEFFDPFGGVVVTTWDSNHGALVLDAVTLRQGKWAQPKSGQWTHFALNDPPARAVGSQNGTILTSARDLLVLTPTYSAFVPITLSPSAMAFSYYGKPTGSITGIIAADHAGTLLRNGLSEDGSSRARGPVSPCGRYRLGRMDTYGSQGDARQVLTVEGGRPLFQIHRLPRLGESAVDGVQQRISIVDNNGSVLVQHAGGKDLLLISADIPSIARGLAPKAFHVTSQPHPLVTEGGNYSYQVLVNNPAMVANCRLRQPVPGASLTSTGLLNYRPPVTVEKAQGVTFSIELVSKDGETLLHEFMIQVIPWRPAAPTQPTRPSNPI
jgi:hypothetical protein